MGGIMSAVFLLLFIVSVFHVGLRSSWRLPSQASRDFPVQAATVSVMLLIGYVYALVSEMPLTPIWQWLGAGLLLAGAMLALVLFGYLMIRPLMLGLSYSTSRAASTSTDLILREERALLVLPLGRFVAGQRRRPYLLLGLAAFVSLLLWFVGQLPEGSEVRQGAASVFLLLSGVGVVVLMTVITRPWGAFVRYQNREDAEAFYLLVVMAFFLAFHLATPEQLEALDTAAMAALMIGVFCFLLCLISLFKYRQTIRRGNSLIAYLLSIPFFLVLCGMNAHEHQEMKRAEASAAEAAAIAARTGGGSRAQQHADRGGNERAQVSAQTQTHAQTPQSLADEQSQIQTLTQTPVHAQIQGQPVSPIQQTTAQTQVALLPASQLSSAGQGQSQGASGTGLGASTALAAQKMPSSPAAIAPASADLTASLAAAATLSTSAPSPSDNRDVAVKTGTPAGSASADLGQVRQAPTATASVVADAPAAQADPAARPDPVPRLDRSPASETLRAGRHLSDADKLKLAIEALDSSIRVDLLESVSSSDHYLLAVQVAPPYQLSSAEALEFVALRLRAIGQLVEQKQQRKLVLLEARVTAVETDRYGHDRTVDVLTLRLGEPHVARINWKKIKVAQLLDLMQAEARTAGLEMVGAYCQQRDEANLMSGAFCRSVLSPGSKVAGKHKAARAAGANDQAASAMLAPTEAQVKEICREAMKGSSSASRDLKALCERLSRRPA